MGDLRRAFAALARDFPLALGAVVNSRETQERLLMEEAALRLAAVSGSRRTDLLDAEVVRRTELFEETQVGTTLRRSEYAPRTAALQSVTDDVARGWL